MLSLLAVPGLLSADVPSQLLAKQWEGIFTRGKALGPRMALVSLAGYAYLMYDRRSQGQSYTSYIAAAVLSLGIMPYTIVFMSATNNALLGVAAGGGGAATKTLGESAVRELVTRWKGLNLVRSVFPLVGAVVGLWSLVIGA